MSKLKYKKGDKVRIKSLDWYNENKDINGNVHCGDKVFDNYMSVFCGSVVTIGGVYPYNAYDILEDMHCRAWTDEMIECKVEDECPQDFIEKYCKSCGTQRCDRTKEFLDGCPYYNAYRCKNQNNAMEEETEPKFKVGDILFYRGETSGYLKVEEIREENGEIRYYETSRNIYLIENDPDVFADKVCSVETEESKSEDELLDEYEELTDRAFKGGYEKCKSDIELNGFQLPEGYIFKDENGNEIHALKIVLEKANTLKTQSDNTLKIQSNMGTETHRGYYTTEEETTNKSKKVAWFTFWDNDFADKVELDLSNRELIQEDGKWFVVKKKKEYPKTYEECLSVLGIYNGLPDVEIYNAKPSECKLFESLIRLKRCRDAYWHTYGEEFNWDNALYYIYTDEYGNVIESDDLKGRNCVLAFPDKASRDAFKENFDPDIEFCKEFL